MSHPETLSGQPPESPESPEPLDSRTRWTIYWLLIVCSVAVMAGRLWQVQTLSYGKSVPFLTANDRSRWCTIRSLGDHDTYAIDFVLQSEDGQSWDSIDKVMHWGRDGRPHFYSSKPTLLPTLLTWPYLAIRNFTGWTLANETFSVVRWMLLVCQVIPLIVFFVATGHMADLVARSNWTRFYVMVCATFGTFVTTFSVTLNNHLPAVVCVSLATMMMIRIWWKKSTHWRSFFLTGLVSGLAASMELPAAVFLLMTAVLCLVRSPVKTVLAFIPAVALVVAAFFATNYQAHKDWLPPYAHRSDGPGLETIAETMDTDLANGELSPEIQSVVSRLRPDLADDWTDSVRIVPGGWPDESNTERRWILYFDSRHQPLILAFDTGSGMLQLRQWNNWYEYPGSYWLTQNDSRSRVDRGETDRGRYLLNLTLWHHGVFSLTPIWFLSLIGVIPLCLSRDYRLRLFGVGVLALSAIVIAFYVARPIEDRNYGGLCCSPRWFFWLAPLWLVAMIPALDSMRHSRVRQAIALLLLGISIASACYAWTNPWTHPWLYHWLGLT